MSHLILQVVKFADAKEVIQSLRSKVFQVEQKVEPTIDFDGLDETATHILAYYASEPIGTARIRNLNNKLAKIERVAVLSTHRGQGIGKAIMKAAIVYVDSQNIAEIKVNAQLHAKAFYQKLGFEQRGDVFNEAGMAHIEMRRSKHPLAE
ncbi:MAG: GNAT family N-acetyltransferase [Cyanobacteria bacterium CRU_2_1]|nr:GNAT family N-acetyltransferase [Cyanobacteria bacterium RU_5_0]NJR59603.1 GNAT family N-acetyltransferase [Cyanobacteria bacterium CRU_2_1]